MCTNADPNLIQLLCFEIVFPLSSWFSFDVRHLLASLEDFETQSEDCKLEVGDCTWTEKELDFERYADVDSDEDVLAEFEPDEVEAYLELKRQKRLHASEEQVESYQEKSRQDLVGSISLSS
jgi:hypothetical protein